MNLNLSVKQEYEVQLSTAVSQTDPVICLSGLVYSRCDDEGCVGEVRGCLSDELDELFGVHAFEGEALMGCKRLSVHDGVCLNGF